MHVRATPTRTRPPTRRSTGSRPVVVTAAALVLSLVALLTGCSSSESAAPEEPVGYTRSPVRSVAGQSLPVAGGPAEPLPLAAPKGGLRLLFLGFTSCPYECPTTLTNLKRAVQQLPEQDRGRVSVGLVSVDLVRDTPDRLTGFVGDVLSGSTPKGVGLLAADDAALRQVTGALGASYSATPNADGTPNITHTDEVYAVDDQGDVVRQWPFDAPPRALAAELGQLLAGNRSLG
ncbi:MAG: SCO family protein [Actinomycetes bacterium]